jgi:hypothetical protein
MKTKESIIKTATVLFSQKGYHGTTIREIAKLGKVNQASINYYFKNKRGLLHEVLKSGYYFLSKKITAQVEKEDLTFPLLTGNIFNILLEHNKIVSNCMQIILHEGFEGFDDIESEGEFFGPPGGLALLQKLTSEVGGNISLETKRWGVISIFSIMFHQTLIINSPYGKRPSVKKILNKNKSREDIIKVAQLILDEIKSNKSKIN